MERSAAYKRLTAPVGKLHLVVSDKGVAALCFDGSFRKHRRNLSARFSLLEQKPAAFTARQRKTIKRTKTILKQYFSGRKLQIESLPLDISGTAFQKKIWYALRRIRAGETTSYAALARQVGRPKAFRAVGTACGENPVGIILPCHRVIGSQGSLGGYAGGLSVKRKLLSLERRHAG